MPRRLRSAAPTWSGVRLADGAQAPALHPQPVLDLLEPQAEARLLPTLQQALLAVGHPFLTDLGPFLDGAPERRVFLRDPRLEALHMLVGRAAMPTLLQSLLDTLELHGELG